MKNSLAQLTRIVVTLLLTFSTFSAVAGRVDSCSQIRGGTFANMWGSEEFRHTQFCNTAPADVQFNETPGVITCRNCFPGNANIAPSIAKAGAKTAEIAAVFMVFHCSLPGAGDLHTMLRFH